MISLIYYCLYRPTDTIYIIAKENDIFCPCVAVSDDKIVVMFYNMSDVLYAAIEFMRE